MTTEITTLKKEITKKIADNKAEIEKILGRKIVNAPKSFQQILTMIEAIISGLIEILERKDQEIKAVHQEERVEEILQKIMLIC